MAKPLKLDDDKPFGKLISPELLYQPAPNVEQAYLNPISKVVWQEAFRKRAKVVQIGNRTFQLTYDDQAGVVRFKPARNQSGVHGPHSKHSEFVPCGAFVLREALTEEWLLVN